MSGQSTTAATTKGVTTVYLGVYRIQTAGADVVVLALNSRFLRGSWTIFTVRPFFFAARIIFRGTYNRAYKVLLFGMFT